MTGVAKIKVRIRAALVVLSGAAVIGGLLPPGVGAADASARHSQAQLPARASIWPLHKFAIGVADDPSDASALRHTAPFNFRYQYLAGGVNTGSGWTTWNPDGTFVTRYDAESAAAGIIPVFSYYMLLQSTPSAGGEAATDLGHLRDPHLMKQYWAQARLFFTRARGTRPVVLQIEPDLWGYLEQANAVALAHSFAGTWVRLRNALAPNVILAYHLSQWGTDHDTILEKPTNAVVRAYATLAASFYRSIHVDFDIAFTDLSDRDADYYRLVKHDPHLWMSPVDFARMALFYKTFVARTGVRLVIWQIPLGNTVMRAENNTWNHYQDNRVQWFLGRDSRAHLRTFAAAGVVALLFGRGADGNTCACDAAKDGVTDPPPIDGNTGVSLSADDDGGYFDQRVEAYYRAGPLALRA